jgi:hypothetical protein
MEGDRSQVLLADLAEDCGLMVNSAIPRSSEAAKSHASPVDHKIVPTFCRRRALHTGGTF